MHITSVYDEAQHARTFTVTVTPEDLGPYFTKAEDTLLKKVKLPGFRAGKVPRELQASKLNPEDIRSEALQGMVGETFQQALKQENVDFFLGNPKFSVKPEDFALDKEFTFTFFVVLASEVTLGDYKNIKLAPPEVTISDEDIKKEREEFEKFLRDLEGEQTKQRGDVPILGQSFIDLLQKYTSLKSQEEFEANAKNALYNRKVRESLSKFSEEVLDTIAAASKIVFSPALVEVELDEMVNRLGSRITESGTSIEEYLKKQDKTIEQLREEQRATAEKSVRSRIVLDKVSEVENITVTDNEIEMEKKIILAPYYGKDKKLTAEGLEISKTLATPDGKTYIARNIVRDKSMNALLQHLVPLDYGKNIPGQGSIDSSSVLPTEEGSDGIILPGQA